MCQFLLHRSGHADDVERPRQKQQQPLAESSHHSSRGQTIARARGELHGHDRGPPTPQPKVFSIEEEPGGARRDRLFAVSGPQERVRRRTVQQIVNFAPLPTLDDPAPQMVEQLPDVLQFFGTLLPDREQVIKVPKILPEDVPVRAVLRDSQLLEQLVEVPTIVSYSSLLLLQVLVEQNVGIAVVGDCGCGGLSGFLPGQNYSMMVEQIVDNPVPRPGGAGGLPGLHRGQSSTAFSEQIDVSADPGGGFQDLQPVQGSKASSPAHPGVGIGCAVELMDAMSLAGVSCRWLRH